MDQEQYEEFLERSEIDIEDFEQEQDPRLKRTRLLSLKEL